jgi:hypothetical protein
MSSILSSSSKTREESAREEGVSKTRDGRKSQEEESEEEESSVEVVREKAKGKGQEKEKEKGKGIRVVSDEIEVEESGGVGGEEGRF